METRSKSQPLFLAKIDSAQVHRETYVAVLNHILRKPGDKQALADRLGIYAEHLSGILNAGVSVDAYIRTPGPRLAEQIVEALPLDPAWRRSLFENMYLAWSDEHEAFAPYAYQRPLTRYAITDLLRDIGQAHVEATHTSDFAEARHKYRVLRRACILIRDRIDPDPNHVDSDDPDFNANPLEFAQICLFLHDVQCVLNRADDALANAKYAFWVVSRCNPNKLRNQEGYYEYLYVNTVVAECLAYRNLNLPKKAYEASQRAEALILELGTPNTEFWLPHILMHRLKALIAKPRFTLTEVDGLLRQVGQYYEMRPNDFRLHYQIGLKEAEARGYLEYGLRCGTGHSIKRADLLLRDLVESIDRTPKRVLGPVHKSRLFRTYAKVKWTCGRLDEWEHYIRLSLEIALTAGLDHQLAQTREEYGPIIESIIDEVVT
jgi:hypothetical protein